MPSDFVPSQAEIDLTDMIFNKCDPKKLGIIAGEIAVPVFLGTKLSNTVLAEVWDTVDEEGIGFLTREGVLASLRLLGHAQRGKPVSKALLSECE